MTRPAQLFLTLKEEYQTRNSVPDILGFVHIYEPTKANFKSKRETQMMWAYGGGYSRHHTERADGVWFGTTNEWDDTIQKYVDIPPRRVPDHLQPGIIDNVAIDGFRVAKSVTRSTTSNKLWRIVDPRGFQLEVSTANMEYLLENAGIVKNEIRGLFVWEHKTKPLLTLA